MTPNLRLSPSQLHAASHLDSLTLIISLIHEGCLGGAIIIPSPNPAPVLLALSMVLPQKQATE